MIIDRLSVDQFKHWTREAQTATDKAQCFGHNIDSYFEDGFFVIEKNGKKDKYAPDDYCATTLLMVEVYEILKLSEKDIAA